MSGGGPALDDLAALGPFFAVAAHPPGTRPRPPWRPVSELAGGEGSLERRIAAVRATLAARGGRPLGEVEHRVAASALHLGLVARLVAPAMGAAVLGWDADVRLDGLWWQDQAGGPVPLSIPAPATERAVPPRAGAIAGGEWAERLLRDAVVPLTDAVSRAAAVSEVVLRGNAASGINAAAGQVARARPDLAGPAWDAARALFARPWLRRERQPPGLAFRRSSCCLFYRLARDPASARSALCGDCVLGEPR